MTEKATVATVLRRARFRRLSLRWASLRAGGELPLRPLPRLAATMALLRCLRRPSQNLWAPRVGRLRTWLAWLSRRQQQWWWWRRRWQRWRRGQASAGLMPAELGKRWGEKARKGVRARRVVTKAELVNRNRSEIAVVEAMALETVVALLLISSVILPAPSRTTRRARREG